MSNSNNQTDLKRGEEDPFPIAAIVCLAVGGYVVIVIVIVIVRYMLVKQGVCKPQCCTSQSGSCCLVCTKLNEACPCCCSSNVDGCLSKICGKRKTTNCVDILLCNCCGCTEGCCDPCKCKDCQPATCCCCGKDGISCCALQNQFSCRPVCTDCWDDDLDSDACGCLCLAIKVRTPRHAGSFRRSSSAPKELTQNHYSTHGPPEKGHTVGTYDQGDFEISEVLDSVYTLKNRNSDVGSGALVRKRSKSLSPKLSMSPRKLLHLDKSNNSLAPYDTSYNEIKQYQSSDHKGKVHVNFDQSSLEENNRILLSGISLSEDSLKSQTSTAGLVRPADTTASSTEANQKAKSSRLRKSLRPGQMSQRFPNKILVSTESLRSSGEMRSSTTSSSIFMTASYLSNSSPRSLPQPNPLSKRPLPKINNAGKSNV